MANVASLSSPLWIHSPSLSKLSAPDSENRASKQSFQLEEVKADCKDIDLFALGILPHLVCRKSHYRLDITLKHAAVSHFPVSLGIRVLPLPKHFVTDPTLTWKQLDEFMYWTEETIQIGHANKSSFPVLFQTSASHSSLTASPQLVSCAVLIYWKEPSYVFREHVSLNFMTLYNDMLPEKISFPLENRIVTHAPRNIASHILFSGFSGLGFVGDLEDMLSRCSDQIAVSSSQGRELCNSLHSNFIRVNADQIERHHLSQWISGIDASQRKPSHLLLLCPSDRYQSGPDLLLFTQTLLTNALSITLKECIIEYKAQELVVYYIPFAHALQLSVALKERANATIEQLIHQLPVKVESWPDHVTDVSDSTQVSGGNNIPRSVSCAVCPFRLHLVCVAQHEPLSLLIRSVQQWLDVIQHHFRPQISTQFHLVLSEEEIKASREGHLLESLSQSYGFFTVWNSDTWNIHTFSSLVGVEDYIGFLSTKQLSSLVCRTEGCSQIDSELRISQTYCDALALMFRSQFSSSPIATAFSKHQTWIFQQSVVRNVDFILDQYTGFQADLVQCRDMYLTELPYISGNETTYYIIYYDNKKILICSNSSHKK